MARLVVDARGRWDLHQRNGVQFGVYVDYQVPETEHDMVMVHGTADGRGRIRDGVVTDRIIMFYIDWPDGKTGDYRGFIYGDRYLRGVALNITDPSAGDSTEWWSAQNTFSVQHI